MIINNIWTHDTDTSNWVVAKFHQDN